MKTEAKKLLGTSAFSSSAVARLLVSLMSGSTLFLNGTLVHPLEHEKWARQSRNRWLTVNVETCIMREHQGYICEGNALQVQDICLDTDQNVCHFEIYPEELTNTVVVYI